MSNSDWWAKKMNVPAPRPVMPEVPMAQPQPDKYNQAVLIQQQSSDTFNEDISRAIKSY
jgi:hypothetical protein